MNIYLPCCLMLIKWNRIITNNNRNIFDGKKWLKSKPSYIPTFVWYASFAFFNSKNQLNPYALPAIRATHVVRFCFSVMFRSSMHYRNTCTKLKIAGSLALPCTDSPGNSIDSWEKNVIHFKYMDWNSKWYLCFVCVWYVAFSETIRNAYEGKKT